MANAYDKSSQEYQDMLQNVQQYIQQMYQQGRGDITSGVKGAAAYGAPYVGAGTTALNSLLASLGLGPEGAKGQQDVYQKFVTGPGYKFAVQQGLQATQKGAAAAGMTGSGAEQRELQRTGQGMAQQKWGDYLQNYQSRLQSLAGMGEQAAMQQAQFQYGGGVSKAQLGQGYAGMDVNAQEMAAKAKAEAEMAKQAEKDQQKNAMWGDIAKLVGGIGGSILGGPMGGSIGSYLSSMFGSSAGSIGSSFSSMFGSSSNPSGYYDYAKDIAW